MQLWSIFWHLRLLSDQPIVVSGIGIARFVPILVFALVGGLVADTFNRKTIVYITQAVMILVAALLGFLTASSRINLTMIYILVVLQGISIAFDGPARQSLVPNLVPREDLSSAFGLQSIATNVGAVIGPALSGWVIAYAGIQWTYWINAISFLAVIAALALMGPIENDAPRRIAGIVDRRYVPRLDFSEIPVGIQFILHQPVILSSMILDFFATFFFFRKYAASLRGPGCAACGRRGLRLAGSSAIHRLGDRGFHHVAAEANPRTGKAAPQGCGRLWPGDADVRCFEKLFF